ncbi:hypothetical protein CPB83DRAFT_903297 [Crepidotus variabilis]|uniref:Uncharacterized protein n=1 Tax=Crepidotus variabilis TaxID=179855 RepID=A0A9P6JT68_9AGAR|nr:hypothetical protein CPB83DRAFT_903297 [Crepidotus variabilis]
MAAAYQWIQSSPVEVKRDIRLFSQIAFVTLGVMLWDVLGNLSFSFSIMRGRRRVTSILYFILQLCMILHPLFVVLSVNEYSGVSCGSRTWLSKVFGLIAVVCSSTMFLLRTIEIWGHGVTTMGGLGLPLLLQIGLWIRDLFPSKRTNIGVPFCDFIRTDSRLTLILTFYYSSLLVFMFFGLSAFKLVSFGRGKTVNRLFIGEGVIYFLPAALAYLAQAVLPSMHRNPVFGILGYPLSVVYPALCACLMYRGITDLGVDPRRPPYTSGFTQPSTNPQFVFASTPARGTPVGSPGLEGPSTSPLVSQDTELLSMDSRELNMKIDAELGIGQEGNQRTAATSKYPRFMKM